MTTEYLAPGITRHHGLSISHFSDCPVTEIDSVGALADACDVRHPEINQHMDGERHRGADLRARHFYRWDGTETTASQMLHDGWTDGLARVQAMTAKIAGQLPPAEDVRRKSSWNHDGELNVDRWLGGYDDCWRGAKRKRTPRFQTVSLACSWGGSSALSLEEMTWSGVAASAATLLLEAAGYSVGLTAISTVDHHNGHHDVALLHVKRAGDGLSEAHLAAVLAHSVSYRFHKLRLTETLPFKIHPAYGHTVALSHGIVQSLTDHGLLEPATLVIPTVRSEAEAVAALTTLLEQVQQPTLA